MIHLHWLYFRGPQIATRNLRRGYSMCSVYCEPEQMTAHVEDTTCAECLARYEAKQQEDAA
jgi:hypothetical protein